MTLTLNAAPAVALNRKRRPERRGEKRSGLPRRTILFPRSPATAETCLRFARDPLMSLVEVRRPSAAPDQESGAVRKGPPADKLPDGGFEPDG